MSFKNFWIQYKVNNLPYEAQIHKESFVIGRSPDCDLTIVSEVVSRRHLKIEHIDKKILVQDLGSTNGTFIDGELLKPNEKYEYKTGDKLYFDVNKQIVLRITVLENKDQLEIELDEQKVLLEKKKHELKSKSKNFSQNDDFINAATEKVDNLFENIKFVAKSARFNKEKAIKLAEHQSVELIEKAKKEIEEERLSFESQLRTLQEETINEAKRAISSAHEKSKKIITKAKEMANELREKTEQEQQAVLTSLEEKKVAVINQAQEKHSEIIGEAFLKNKELKEENSKLQIEIYNKQASVKSTQQSLMNMTKEKEYFSKEYFAAKEIYEEKLESLNALKTTLKQMELKKEVLLKELDVEIPQKEKHLNTLKQEILTAQRQCQDEAKNLDQLQDEIAKFQDQAKKDEEKSIRAEQRVDELTDRVLEAEDNLFRLTKIKQQRTDEIEKEIAERKQRQIQLEDAANKKLDVKKEKVQKEIDVNLAKAKELAIQLVKDAKVESERTLCLAQEESKSILEQTKLESELCAQDIKKEAQELLAKSQAEVAKSLLVLKTNKEAALMVSATIKKEADDYSKDLRERVERETKELRNNLDSIIAEEKAKVIVKAQAEAALILEKAESEKKNKKLLLDELEQKMRSDLEKEIKEKKKEADLEIQSIRSNTVYSMEEQKKNLQKEEEQKNNIRAMRLRKELNDVLRARINPFLKDISHLDKVANIIEKSINAIMLDEIDNDFIETENYSDFDPTVQQKKVKRFWLYSGVTALVVILFFVYIPDFKKAAVESSRSIAAKADSDTKSQIEQTQKINDLSKEFHPEKVEEYKESYTQRVLYTQDYVETELGKEYREKWIIDLQEYFVHTLRLDENKLVPFIAQEANLIRELDEAMKKINGNFVKEGVKKMEEIESDFIKKIRENIKSKNDFTKIMNFKKEFFINNKKNN